MFDIKLKCFSKLIIGLTLLVIATPCRCRNDSNSATEFDFRILNGISAADFQFPYQVSLQKHRKHHCGGCIISEKKVLTAGHCVINADGTLSQTNAFGILAGTNKLNVKKPKYFFPLKQFSIHPQYDRRTIHYDYAVCFIDGTFDFRSTTQIAMIPLATRNPPPGTVCYLSGWGDVEKGSRTTIPNDLQFARITIDAPEKCQEVFGNYFKPKQMLCAGRTNNENAGCGDSGSPLCCNNELNGIVSFGRDYDDPKFPDVYSNVVYALEWIESTNGSRKVRIDGLHFHFVLIVSVTLKAIIKI